MNRETAELVLVGQPAPVNVWTASLNTHSDQREGALKAAL